jgi:hypothetical protein
MVSLVLKGCSRQDEIPISTVETIALARFVEPIGEELSFEDIIEDQAFIARMRGFPYDAAAIAREMMALERLASDATRA